MEAKPPKRVVVTGGAGLVGLNLAARLEARRDLDVVFIDKHHRNLMLLGSLFPRFRVVHGDLANNGAWQSEIRKGDVVVVLHAQVTSKRFGAFERNNILATERLVQAAKDSSASFLIHLSSSVLNSRVEDDYVRTKRRQEDIIRASGIDHCVLRPTLMYGWFDPKHLGWLARFMARSPVFPIPGNGRFVRQPLYVQDVCRIVEWCVDNRPDGQIYDLTGPDHITYLSMIRAIRDTQGLNRPIVRLPMSLFRVLLSAYARISRNPPFTKDQLDSLAAGDDFYGVDMTALFGIHPTAFLSGIHQTLTDGRFGAVVVNDPEDTEFSAE